MEILYIGNPKSPIKVLFTCRHHCCEATASYVLEGILEAVLGEDETGAWFRDNVDCVVIPFIDKDGVEAGDQGKNRAPHDHNRDYAGNSIYPEVQAIRRFVPVWLQEGRSCIALDLHCPHICGEMNEEVYFVGNPSLQIWEETQELSRIWERSNDSPIPFDPRNNLPFGQKWNVANNYAQGKSFGKWACELPQVQLASAIEFPYANAGGAEVNQVNYRELGKCLAKALRTYIEAE